MITSFKMSSRLFNTFNFSVNHTSISRNKPSPINQFCTQSYHMVKKKYNKNKEETDTWVQVYIIVAYNQPNCELTHWGRVQHNNSNYNYYKDHHQAAFLNHNTTARHIFHASEIKKFRIPFLSPSAYDRHHNTRLLHWPYLTTKMTLLAALFPNPPEMTRNCLTRRGTSGRTELHSN
jgi:hypothetical protein